MELLLSLGNILIRKLVRLCLSIFYLFPIKCNRVMLKSFYGKSYSCNPKYICEYLRTHYPKEFELLVVLNNPNDYPEIDGIKWVKNKSLSFYYYRLTAKIIISNMTDEVYIPKRKEQIFINTWHAGGAYKRVGKSYLKKENRATNWQNKMLCQETDYYLSSSTLFSMYNIRDAYGFDGTILDYGLPRNDLFFDVDKVVSCRKKIESLFNLQDKFIVLYAPTFRGDFVYNNAIDFLLPSQAIQSAIKEKYGKEAVILNRLHYNDRKSLTRNSDEMIGMIDVSTYPDMQELLAASDLLVTDYSSSIWDYALLNRPCLLYVPDLQTYKDDRGWYTPISNWPGYVCETEQDLVQAIARLDAEDIIQKSQDHLTSFGSFERGTACQQIAQLILSLSTKGKSL